MRPIDGDYISDALEAELCREGDDLEDRQWAYGYAAGVSFAVRKLAEAPTLTPPNEPLTLEDAKKERYIWFTPLNDWGKVTPFGVLFFGSEELMTWETLCEEWGYRFKSYRRLPEGEEGT